MEGARSIQAVVGRRRQAVDRRRQVVVEDRAADPGIRSQAAVADQVVDHQALVEQAGAAQGELVRRVGAVDLDTGSARAEADLGEVLAVAGPVVSALAFARRAEPVTLVGERPDRSELPPAS